MIFVWFGSALCISYRFVFFIIFLRCFVFLVACSDMGKRKLKEKEDDTESESVEAKRKRQVKWTQEETERLAALLLECGCTAIMNKTTNGATNEMKKAEWKVIANRFNAHPSVSFGAFQVQSRHSFLFLSLSFYSAEYMLPRRNGTRESLQATNDGDENAQQMGA